MPPSSNLSEDFLTWLSSDKCVPWLMQQARYLLVRLHDLNLPSGMWPHGNPDQMQERDRLTAVEETAHEFWLFSRSFLSEGHTRLPLEASPRQGLGLSLTGAYLRSAFTNHLRSKARRKNQSLARHLYRRLRETLRRAPGFYYLAQKQRTFYSMEEQAPITETRISQSEGAYGDWRSPCELVSESQLYRFKSEHLCLIAELFWKEASVRLAGPCYLPVWELAAYCIQHYGLFREGEQMTTGYAEGLMAGDLSILSPDKGGLQLLAAQLVSSWSPKRRMVFYLAMDSGEITYREISAKAGLSNAGHAKYHLDRACRELADFCECWPGLTPQPEDKAFWTEFLMITADVCKNSLQGRPVKMKEEQAQAKDVT